jgi:hypothetical protein
MSQEIQVYDFETAVSDFNKLSGYAKQLMQYKHYEKLGEVGIFAITQKALSLNISPLDALNGALYMVNGKIEMSSAMMNHLIRVNGHSITKDPKSDDKICILHGKRKDNGDTWTESFSIQDAITAGIYKEGPWKKYPKDMLFARALSRLARQLFADVIKGCYVEGEIIKDSLQEAECEEVDKPKRQSKSKTIAFEMPKEEVPKQEEKLYPTQEETEMFFQTLGKCDLKYQKPLREYFRNNDILKMDYKQFLKMRDAVSLKAELYQKEMFEEPSQDADQTFAQ